jgi:nitrite transporter NirC
MLIINGLEVQIKEFGEITMEHGTLINNFFKSIMAGMCISIGCICYLSVDNKVIGSLLFSVGLLAILTYGFNLYTGKIGQVKTLKDIYNCFIYLIGNMYGCAMTYGLIMFSPIYNNIQEKILIIVANKLLIPLPELFILGIICGILMLFATKNKSNIVLTMFCVAVFILIGAEHSVADSFYLLACNDILKYFEIILTVALGNAFGAIVVNNIIELN